MEKRKKMPKSVKKFIRAEKSRIRRQFFDIKKQKEEITQLYKRLTNDPTAEKVEKRAVVKQSPKKEKTKKDKKVKTKK